MVRIQLLRAWRKGALQEARMRTDKTYSRMKGGLTRKTIIWMSGWDDPYRHLDQYWSLSMSVKGFSGVLVAWRGTVKNSSLNFLYHWGSCISLCRWEVQRIERLYPWAWKGYNELHEWHSTGQSFGLSHSSWDCPLVRFSMAGLKFQEWYVNTQKKIT